MNHFAFRTLGLNLSRRHLTSIKASRNVAGFSINQNKILLLVPIAQYDPRVELLLLPLVMKDSWCHLLFSVVNLIDDFRG